MTPYAWICEPDTPQTLLIDLVSPSLRSQTVSLFLALTSTSGSAETVNITQTITPQPNGFNRVDIKLPVALSPGQYDLNVTARSSDGIYEFTGALRGIDCRSNQNGVYIITNKPVYRESEKG